MTLSILHRMTGIAMSVGLVLFVAWLAAIAWPAVPYEGLDRFFDSGPGRLLLLGWCFSFFFHLANGIRHLLWDTGRLLEKSQAATSSWFVIVSAVLMTAVYWLSV